MFSKFFIKNISVPLGECVSKVKLHFQVLISKTKNVTEKKLLKAKCFNPKAKLFLKLLSST